MTDYLRSSLHKHPLLVCSVVMGMVIVLSVVYLVGAQEGDDPRPSPVAAVSGLDCRWLDEPPRWHVDVEQAAGRGSLVLDLAADAERSDILLQLAMVVDEDAGILGMLIDADGEVLAADLWGAVEVAPNLLNAGTVNDLRTGELWLEVPLEQHGTAGHLVIQRLKGHIEILGGIVYPAKIGNEVALTPESAATLAGWPLALDEAVAASVRGHNPTPAGKKAIEEITTRVEDAPKHGPARRSTVQELARQTMADLLSSRQAARSVSCAQWRNWAKASAGDMSYRQRLKAAGALVSAFAADEADLNGLTSAEFKALVAAVAALNPEAGPDLIRDWLSSPARLHGCPAGILAWLLRQAGEWRSQEGNLSTLSEDVAARIADRLLRTADRLDLADLLNGVKGCMYANVPGRAGQLATEAWTQAVAAGQWDLPRLRLIAEILSVAELCDEKHSYPEYAAALRRILAGDPEIEPGEPELLAKPLCSRQQRRILQQELLADNTPSVALGLVLSWAHRRNHADLKKWQSLVAGKVKETSGDIRAYWCLISGEADVASSPDKCELRRVRWLDRAGREAGSRAGKRRALEAHVRHYRQCNRPREGLKYLEPKLAAYGGVEAERLARLRSRVEKEADARRLSVEQKQAFRAELRAERRNKELAAAGR